jgi:hypothetical protein
VGVSYATYAVAYLAFAVSPSLGLAALALLVANAGGSILWTYATALMQRITPEPLRGRVFASDFGWMTLAMALSTVATGWAFDRGVSPRLLMAGLGAMAVAPITVWVASQRHFRTASR